MIFDVLSCKQAAINMIVQLSQLEHRAIIIINPYISLVTHDGTNPLTELESDVMKSRRSFHIIAGSLVVRIQVEKSIYHKSSRVLTFSSESCETIVVHYYRQYMYG